MTLTKHPEKPFDHTRSLEWFEEKSVMTGELWEEIKTAGGLIWSKFFKRTIKELQFLFSRFTAFDMVMAVLTISILTLAGVVLVAGLGLLAYQAFTWLRSGVWTEFPLLVLFNLFFEHSPVQGWLDHPQSWIGLQKVIEWLLNEVPLSLALIAPSAGVMMITVTVSLAAVLFRFYQFKQTDKN